MPVCPGDPCPSGLECSSNGSCIPTIATSDSIIIVMALVPILFIGIFVGLFCFCIWRVRSMQRKHQKEVENQAEAQIVAERQAL